VCITAALSPHVLVLVCPACKMFLVQMAQERGGVRILAQLCHPRLPAPPVTGGLPTTGIVVRFRAQAKIYMMSAMWFVWIAFVYHFPFGSEPIPGNIDLRTSLMCSGL
jgi:uncharacterized protein YbaR (Trm112 family)